GGAGTADAAHVALRTLSRRLTGDASATGMWFLSSARARDEAGGGTLVAALPGAGETGTARTRQRQGGLGLARPGRRPERDFPALRHRPAGRARLGTQHGCRSVSAQRRVPFGPATRGHRS